MLMIIDYCKDLCKGKESTTSYVKKKNYSVVQENKNS